jgi:hypothetical protein
LAQQKKPRKVGRPKLPKGAAKGRIVPVRFAVDDLRTITNSARANKQTVSEWVRIALPLEAKQQHKGYLIQLATRPARERGFTTSGWITNEIGRGKPISVVPPGSHLTKQAALEFGISWCKEKIYMRSTNDAKIRP